jgi:hypothetical protein
MSRKIYACYSPSHARLLEQHFLPSIPTGFDVVLRKLEQVCETGEYRTPHWGRAMEQKVVFILGAIDRETKPFIFSDVDVRFYDFTPEHFDSDMQQADLRCQDDGNEFCAGFMFIRPSVLVHKLFRTVLETTPEFGDDQAALNICLTQPEFAPLRKSLLPKARYWNIGPACDAPAWDGGSIPNIAVHHGNWTIGLDKKLQLMDKVQALCLR